MSKLLNLGCGRRFHKDWINLDFIATPPFVKSHNLLEGLPFDSESIDVIYHSHLLEHFSKEKGFFLLKECFRVLRPKGIIRIVVPDLELIAIYYLKNLNNALKGCEIAKANHEWMIIELYDQFAREESGGEMLKYISKPNLVNLDFIYSRLGMSNVKNMQKHALNQSKIHDTTFFRKVKSFFFKIKEKKVQNFRKSGEIHQWMYDRVSLCTLLLDVGFNKVNTVDAFTSKIPNWKEYQYLDVENNEPRKPDSLFIEAQKT